MTPIAVGNQTVRRKAVWGPKSPQRTIAAIGVFVLGLTSGAFASGQHTHPAPTAKPGVPGRKAEHPKLDKELTSRADHQNPNATTSVIVTLQSGATLPAEFKQYARAGKLNLINGHVVDLP